MRLTPKTIRLIDDLCKKAKTHGWEKDQGFGDNVQIAKKAFEKARQTLIDYLKAR